MAAYPPALSMSSLLLLIACLLLGMLTAHVGRPPEGLARSLNWWVLNIALPALVLEIIPQLRFDWNLWVLPASLWLGFLGAWACFAWLGKRCGWSRATIGAVVLTAGLANTSFVGFPLIEALRGKEALRYAAVADQFGSFFVLAVGGSLVTAVYAGHKTSAAAIARQIFFFPPFIATLVAVAVSLAGGWPIEVEPYLARIGATLTPLALFAVGLQLRLCLRAAQIPMLSLGLAWKLAVAPLLVFLLARTASDGPVFSVAVLQSAMAPMITAAIVADQYKLEPLLANMIVGIGILLSMITVPLWNMAL